MTGQRAKFRDGAKVRYLDQVARVERTRFNASGREWVDITYLGGWKAGLVTTAPVEQLSRLEDPIPTRLPAADGELA